MDSNFSISENHFTPIRPQKVERLFSPSPAKIRHNDLTYQVPTTPIYRASNDGDKYPRHSTGLVKVNKPPPEKELITRPFVGEEVSINQENIAYPTNLEATRSIHMEEYDHEIPQYRPFYRIKDPQPTRATCFHPTGDVFVVGSNSKTIRICVYPSEDDMESFSHTSPELEPSIAFKFSQTHRGSVYCASFNNSGNLLATGSNDQTVHVIKYNRAKRLPEGPEYKLTMHSGTIRDLCFLQKDENKGILATAGAGDFEIYLTDCETMKPVRMLLGHESPVMSLNSVNDTSIFYSASLDGTIRLWDARSKLCNKIISTVRPGGDAVVPGKHGGTPVCVVRVEDTGKLLVSGHTDGRCMLYDIRGDRVVQLFKAHDDEIRSLNFSPKSYYLLTASYDHKVKLTDLQGNLTGKLPSVDVAQLDDKVVQTAWHPDDYSFITTSADGSAILWALPDFARTVV